MQYPDSPFILEKAQKWIILPHALVDEVKRIPEHQASFLRTNYERFQGHYTGIGTFTPDEGIAALRNDLPRNIDKVLCDLQDEVSYALDKEIGDCHTWTEATLYRNVLGIIARLSALTFVGMTLCRDEAWIAATKSLSTDIIITMYTIKWFSPWVRPFVTPFLSQYRKLIWYNFFLSSKLKPQVTAIVDAYKTNSMSRDAIPAEDILDEKVAKENQNLVHWTIGNFKDPARVGVVEIGRQFYVITFAAIHTTGAALTHVLFDIAAHPEYAKILREEIDAVVAEENHLQGRLLKTSIPKLKKLDSFIKESQRVNPMTMSSFPFPLSSRYTSNISIQSICREQFWQKRESLCQLASSFLMAASSASAHHFIRPLQHPRAQSSQRKTNRHFRSITLGDIAIYERSQARRTNINLSLLITMILHLALAYMRVQAASLLRTKLRLRLWRFSRDMILHLGPKAKLMDRMHM
jgi:hypothetical protein